MFKITPPIGQNVAFCNIAKRLLVVLLALLLAGAVVWCGYHDTRHQSVVWAEHIPSLYVPTFYDSEALEYYISQAYHTDDPEALCVAGTAAYNLRVFDRQALDSLPAVELDDADKMLQAAAFLGYQPAFTVISYLHTLGLWHHSLPSNTPTIVPLSPAPGDPDYILMKVKK